MAKGEYAIQISGKVQQAIDALQEVQKELKGVGGAVKKGGAEVRGLSVEFLAFGATLVGTASSVTFMGASVETAMFRSRVAVERLGVSVEGLTDRFHAAGLAASELLPVAAQFARFGVAGDQLEAASKVAFEFGLATEMGTKKAGAALSSLAGAMGLKTEPEVRRLASGLTALERAYPGTIESNQQLLLTLGPTARRMGVTADTLAGLNVVMQNHGVEAGAASGALRGLLETFRFGTNQAKAMAMSFGLSGAALDRFGQLAPRDQMLEMFKTMRNLSDIDLEVRLEGLGIATGSARDAIVKMVRSGKDLETVLLAARDGFKDGSALAAAFGEKSDTLQGSIALLWQELRAIGSETGRALIPVVTLAVKTLTALLGIVKIIPAPIRALAVGFIGLSGAVMLVSRFLQTALIGDFLSAAKNVGTFAQKIAVATMGLLEMARNALVSAATGLGKLAAASGEALKSLGAMGLGVLKAGARLLVFAGRAIVSAVIGLGSLTASALTFVATAVPAMVSGLGAIATAAWAAIAPLLPFIAIGALVVAAAVAIGYAIYKVVQVISDNWTPIWESVSAGLGAAWDGLKAVGGAFVDLGRLVGGGIVSAFRGFWGVLQSVWGVISSVSTAIWEGLIGGLKTLWGWVVSAGEAIAAPFVALWDVLKGIGGAIGDVVGWLFGSSLFHLKEGVAEVMPALTRMEGAFTGIGRAAGKVGLESHIPDDIRVRIAEPAGAVSGSDKGGLSDDLRGKQAFGGPAGSGREGSVTQPPAALGATGAGEGTASTVRVVIPVTMVLDGEVLGRAHAEYDIDLGRDRFMNPTLEPMRGTGR